MRWCTRAAAGAVFLAAGCGEPVATITDCTPLEGLEPICGFQNPEDLVVLPGGEWLAVSQFPEHLGSPESRGSLVAYRPLDGKRLALFPSERAAASTRAPGVGSDACPGAPDAQRFAPHGIDLARDPSGRARLLVVNHGGREAIEIFDLVAAAGGPALSWLGCIPLPDDALANDVAALGDGGVAATKFLPRDFGLLALVRVALGFDTGHVLVWKPGDDWRIVPESAESAPNGIAASADGSTLYVASWGGQRLVRIGRDGSDRAEVALGFHPDNITWTAEGRMLLAGHLGSVMEVRACDAIEDGTCGTPFAVAEVDPDSLEVELVFRHDPATRAGAASVALEHAGSIWIGTFSGDRLLRVPSG